jgi:hypothetical protein
LEPTIANPSHLNEKPFKIYNSGLLDKNFKPNVEDLKISPKLEPLKPLILSQHEVFSQQIQDLGLICLTLIKLIEKKKDSLLQPINNNKIPISLRLKCELTTSPAYIGNIDFLQLKEYK